jgi:biotin-dependent carboxylase-like uncharacterized protein
VTGVLRVIRAGIATTFQDRGRPGLAQVGVGAAGAVDPGLSALVNRLVGNPGTAVVVETCGGLELEATGPVVVASSAHLAPEHLAAGERLVVRPGARGRLWHYVAVPGGFAVEPVLGSASRDTLAGIGPAPLVEGQPLAARTAPSEFAMVDHAPLPELDPVVRVLPGPRRHWFSDAAWEALTTAPWTVTTTSRIGVRLSGAPVERIVTGELPSEGLVRGAIQVPPGGEPVVMLADHPTTGGYPVIAVVHPDDVAALAQHSAGSRVRFRHYG